MNDKTYNQLNTILLGTDEGKAYIKAVDWCNRHFPEMTQAEIDEHYKRFEEKIGKPLDRRWEILLKQYHVEE